MTLVHLYALEGGTLLEEVLLNLVTESLVIKTERW